MKSYYKDEEFMQWVKELPLEFVEYLYKVYELNNKVIKPFVIRRSRLSMKRRSKLPELIDKPMSHNESLFIYELWQAINKKD